MGVRIGVGGASPMARQGREAFFSYLDAAEAQGWDSVWFTDRIIEPTEIIDPLVGMAMAAARTERLKFGTGVLLMSMRSPVTTARALASIDALSGGRLVVGVGVGHEGTLEYDAMGVRKSDRGRRLNEAVRVMRHLWTQEKASYDGEFLKITGGGLNPKPSQQSVPIWIGGRTEAAMRRAGRLGDGWLPAQVTPEDAAEGIARVQQYAAEAGRHVSDDHFGVNLGCYVVESGPVPMDRVSQYLLQRRHDVGLDQVHLIGTPDQVQARIREYVDAGITKFVFGPACGPDEMIRQMEIQAETVVKVFHQRPPVKAVL
jgi:probable F420-dependent oxidoreductase